MHPLMKTLQQDHYNFLKLLNCVQREVDMLESGQMERPFNVMLVVDALDYLKTYPEQWHHPLEDALVKKLHARADEQAKEVDWLMAEHKSLEAQTKIAQRVYQQIAAGHVVPRERLIEETRGFVHGQLAHIHRENARLYPLLIRLLTDDDMDAVAEAVPEREDGLFGSLQRAQYQHLGAELVHEAAMTQGQRPEKDGGFVKSGL
ncbi:hemerythrin domain-containing protein [Simiduia agarivorans]|uniref:Hemerythrin hhE cation binding domain-containing protein n=1 Tax=Simiduia agarivorans (strain DSM 21679 / JCM 13881 / BCRC 17597 / SA1) TaxID=1117647 RepID=K4KH16_SIMAS|nr:hemerythrin domain-containing protein [Simiduia agarivorans]AFU98291.1 hemerythrin hhE cation binding domain-containing protein [Simiduia agarivorans SA1 = DSM 21679]